MGGSVGRAVLAMALGLAGVACGARTGLGLADPPARHARPDAGDVVRLDAAGLDAAGLDAPAPPDAGTPTPPPDSGVVETLDGAIALPPDVRPRTTVAAGWRHTCAVARGDVWCWGFDSAGQAGGWARADRVLEPVHVDVGGAAVEVSAGILHSCALLGNGDVRCWGSNDLGQLGDGTRETRLRPVVVLDLHDAVRIAAAGEHTCALRVGGEVWCWGHDGFGQLGDGSRVTRARPAPVHALTDVVDLVAGRRHTCAVRRSGALYCWGAGAQGQLGVPSGDHTEPRPVPGYANVRSVAAGAYHTCALGQTDSVDCWGSVVRAGEGDGVWFEERPVLSFYDIQRVSGGDLGTTCAIFGPDAELRCTTHEACTRWDDPSCIQIFDVGGISHATSVSVGYEHGCAELDGGGIACWGDDQFGQRGDGAAHAADRWVASRVLAM